MPKPILEYFKQQLKLSSTTDQTKVIQEDLIQPTIYNFLILNNKLATATILVEACALNYDYNKVLTNEICGEAKVIGFSYAILAYFLIIAKTHQALSDQDLIKKLEETVLNLRSLKFVDLTQLKNSFEAFKMLLGEIPDLRENLSGLKKIKVCLISGGETTVNLKSVGSSQLDLSKGGRNQELTLAFELLFSQFEVGNNELSLLFSSFGSDGIDGPTDAAGAYFEYYSESNVQKLPNYLEEIDSYLARHDSYNYFEKRDRLLITGPTGTNISDLQILLLNI